MPWTFRIYYGERSPKQVTVTVDKPSYFGAIKAADAEGHRPPRCKVARAEYESFAPKAGGYNSPEWKKAEAEKENSNKEPKE